MPIYHTDGWLMREKTGSSIGPPKSKIAIPTGPNSNKSYHGDHQSDETVKFHTTIVIQARVSALRLFSSVLPVHSDKYIVIRKGYGGREFLLRRKSSIPKLRTFFLRFVTSLLREIVIMSYVREICL